MKNIDEIVAGLGEYKKSYYKSYVGTSLSLTVIPFKWGKAKKVLNGKESKVMKEVRELIWTNHGFKHVPKKGMSNKEIIKVTKNGPAKYFNGIDIKKLEIEGWNKGKKVTNGKDWKVMKYDKPIGAKYGKESRWQRIEKSAGVIHGHPITEQEYLKLIK